MSCFKTARQSFTTHLTDILDPARILEMQIVISHLMRQFSFSLPENVSIHPANAITLVPIDGDGKMHLPLRIECL
jgi:hypothetical protein